MFLAASVAASSFAFAQEQKPAIPSDSRNPVKETLDRTDRAADRAGEAAKSTGDKLAADAKPLALPAGVTAKELNEQGDIRNAFEAITEGAMSKDAFDNIVNRLVDADRDRISKFKGKPDRKALTDRVAELQRMWKDKYGKDFDLDEKVVFGTNGYVAIAQGEISDPAQLVGHWPAPVQPGSAAMPAAANKPGVNAVEQAKEAPKVGGGDANLDKGRNVALARYPAGHGMPALEVSLTHELPDIWRFDVPDTLDAQKLQANLLEHLNALGDAKSWPDDVNEAYRAVGHHVLMAIYDVPSKQMERRPE
jgi:hypothetical protein